MEKVEQKRCIYCGRFLKPDRRVVARQKSCKDNGCRSKLKKESQRRWLEANPGYFRGRYPNTKQWRESNPGCQRAWRAKRRKIQDEIPPKKPLITLRLVIPPCMKQITIWIAQLGGFLARKGDGEPGVTHIWRGLNKFADIIEGAQMFKNICG